MGVDQGLQEMALEWVNQKHFELSNAKTKESVYIKFDQLNSIIIFLEETAAIDFDTCSQEIERMIKTYTKKKEEVLKNEMY